MALDLQDTPQALLKAGPTAGSHAADSAAAHAGLRSRRAAAIFESECARLRPLGEAYIMRRFGGQLNSADAEDAVSDVLIRLHRLHTEGRPPRNLRAAFFTSVRNAAIDQLRSRGSRPTVGLEAAMDRPAEGPLPSEHAESQEEAAQVREALGLMRPNYREAIVLRFGVGLTVPEIAEHKAITLSAAKKLVLRATHQAKDRVLAVTSAEHCSEMQELARTGSFEASAAGMQNADAALGFERHLAHCGHCRHFLEQLKGSLHDYGTGMLVSATASDQLTSQSGALDHLGGWLHGASESAHAAAEKARVSGFKLAGSLQGGESAAASGLAGTGQKIAAVCATGATAATCLAAGVVGPGVSIGSEPDRAAPSSEARSDSLTPGAGGWAEPPAADASTEDTATTAATPPKPVQQITKEVGFEQPQPSAAAPAGGGEFGTPTAGSGGGGAGAGGGGFGFE